MQRIFLDWNRPGLVAAAEHFVKRYGQAGMLDLGGLIVVVPGHRAGRRLLEILVERAEAHGWGLCPPRIVTVGVLPELLYQPKRPFADDTVQQLAWAESIRNGRPEHLQRLTPALPADDDLMGWLALGTMLSRLHRELAADGLDFPAVLNCGRQLADFRETERWEALADLQRGYLDILNGLELWDQQTARLIAIQHGECRTDKRIVLLGTVDLNRTMRLMLDQVAEQVTALVLAPAELAEHFDEHGCLRPSLWQDAPIRLSAEQVEVVDSPADQAVAVVRALAKLGERYSIQEITVGVPDDRLVPFVQQHLEQCEIPSRSMAGLPLTQSSPYRLLSAVADYLESGRFAAFAALVRHPAMEAWLASQGMAGDWLSEMDAYYSEHFPTNLGEAWLGQEDDWAGLRQVVAAVERLLDGFRAAPHPLREWSAPVADLLTSLFGRDPLDTAEPAEWAVLNACDQIHCHLVGHLQMASRLEPSLGGAAAIRLVLRQTAGGNIATRARRDALELLGWLELPLDDAPVLVVTSLNEGVVPASVNGDMFLPNQLRRALGIEDNDRRYARDAYALSVLLASRAQVRLIAGRRNAEGDPLNPSRLLFACNEETAARRALVFFASQDARRTSSPLAGTLRPGQRAPRFDVPRPAPLAEPVRVMRVTEFRDYLACPYRYYLRHRLRLATLNDAAEELDAAAFGSLAHDVLEAFGQSEVAASTSIDEIQDYLGGALNRAVLRQCGDDPLPAIRVQVEQMRSRLMAFARWQAEWARQGWRIELVETQPEESRSPLLGSDPPMYLRGRFDRLDVHQRSGERMIFDYKTSDAGKTPDQVHRSDGEWTDLQLPLYRHLVRGLGIQDHVRLAYILLPKDIGRVGDSRADWSEADLREADRAAAKVVRQIRAEVFWPPTSPPPPFSEEFAAICQDGQFGVALAMAAEGTEDRS